MTALEIIIPIVALVMLSFGWIVGRYGGGVSTTAVQRRDAARGRRTKRRP